MWSGCVCNDANDAKMRPKSPLAWSMYAGRQARSSCSSPMSELRMSRHMACVNTAAFCRSSASSSSLVMMSPRSRARNQPSAAANAGPKRSSGPISERRLMITDANDVKMRASTRS